MDPAIVGNQNHLSDGCHREYVTKNAYVYFNDFYMFSLQFSEKKYPEVYQLLKTRFPRILTEFCVHMCKSEIVYKGRTTQMTRAMEQILCEGCNFEHTHGSVHGSKLQLLFQLYSTWKISAEEYFASFKSEVCLFCVFSFHIFVAAI